MSFLIQLTTNLIMKYLPLLIFIAVSFTFIETGYTHGGRLAADGCHNQKSTGTRHCHRSQSPSKRPSSTTPRAAPSTTPSGESSSGCLTSYNRDSWHFRGYRFSTNIGYYSNQRCESIDADHVVSLRDAHYSGGCNWNSNRRAQFANDLVNLVPSCARINRSKGASVPNDFIRKSRDGKGVEFDFTTNSICKYLTKYKEAKDKYGLSFAQNSRAAFSRCGLNF